MSIPGELGDFLLGAADPFSHLFGDEEYDLAMEEEWPRPSRDESAVRRERQLDREQFEREAREKAYFHRQMDEAMGPDYDPDAFATYP